MCILNPNKPFFYTCSRQKSVRLFLLELLKIKIKIMDKFLGSRKAFDWFVQMCDVSQLIYMQIDDLLTEWGQNSSGALFSLAKERKENVSFRKDIFRRRGNWISVLKIGEFDAVRKIRLQIGGLDPGGGNATKRQHRAING